MHWKCVTSGSQSWLGAVVLKAAVDEIWLAHLRCGSLSYSLFCPCTTILRSRIRGATRLSLITNAFIEPIRRATASGHRRSAIADSALQGGRQAECRLLGARLRPIQPSILAALRSPQYTVDCRKVRRSRAWYAFRSFEDLCGTELVSRANQASALDRTSFSNARP